MAPHRLGNVCKGVETMATRRELLISVFGAGAMSLIAACGGSGVS